jgi:uncharacterized membrane protein YhaH (DUF805 family)
MPSGIRWDHLGRGSLRMSGKKRSTRFQRDPGSVSRSTSWWVGISVTTVLVVLFGVAALVLEATGHRDGKGNLDASASTLVEVFSHGLTLTLGVLLGLLKGR